MNIDTIVSDPKNRSGRPVIVGTTITVSDIVASHLYRGFAPEDLAVQFNLALGQVYAALAYYYMHKAAIDADMQKDINEAQIVLDELDRAGKLIRLG